MNVAGARVVDTVVPKLVNELGEVPQKALVLDDYQFATDDRCRESMEFFVEHLPENIHLVLATPLRPASASGTAEGQGRMAEIRTEELAFTEKRLLLC